LNGHGLLITGSKGDNDIAVAQFEVFVFEVAFDSKENEISQIVANFIPSHRSNASSPEMKSENPSYSPGNMERDQETKRDISQKSLALHEYQMTISLTLALCSMEYVMPISQTNRFRAEIF
jgi:hypothetical protein